MDAAIRVRSLTRRFGRLAAVDHVEFDVHEGEIFGFLGPNGAGKTTTVRMLTGIIDPTAGTAEIRGHDVRTQPVAARRHLGIVPEEANVYLDLSVWRNVMLMGQLHGVPRRERTERGRRLLERLGLADRRDQRARSLSKGLRQRLMLCSALVGGPQILFLDEPTSGLDVHSARLMRDIVREMNAEGLTVFLTTHNMAEAEEMCNRVAIINRGRIVAIDTPDQLRGAMRSSQYVEVSFAGKAPVTGALGALPGVEQVAGKPDGYRLYSEHPARVAVEVALLARQEGWGLEAIATCKPTLEDVFLHLTGANAEEEEST